MPVRLGKWMAFSELLSWIAWEVERELAPGFLVLWLPTVDTTWAITSSSGHQNSSSCPDCPDRLYLVIVHPNKPIVSKVAFFCQDKEKITKAKSRQIGPLPVKPFSCLLPWSAAFKESQYRCVGPPGAAFGTQVLPYHTEVLSKTPRNHLVIPFKEKEEIGRKKCFLATFWDATWQQPRCSIRVLVRHWSVSVPWEWKPPPWLCLVLPLSASLTPVLKSLLTSLSKLQFCFNLTCPAILFCDKFKNPIFPWVSSGHWKELLGSLALAPAAAGSGSECSGCSVHNW